MNPMESDLVLRLLRELWVISRDGFRRATKDLRSEADPWSPRQSHEAQGRKDAYRIVQTVMLSGDYADICDLYIEKEPRILIDSRTGKPPGGK